MQSILIYYGPKSAYEKIIPQQRKPFQDLISEHDIQIKTVFHQILNGDQDVVTPKIEKQHIENLVAYSDSYAGITEGAVQSFVSILNSCEIDHLFLQNPPTYVHEQLDQSFPGLLKVEKYEYKKLTKKMFTRINSDFNKRIIGQDEVKDRLLAALYNLIGKGAKKPVVIMFYGNSGIGKTETAKFISEVVGQTLFRKQLSMYHSGEYQYYIFGGNHSQPCLARDLLERESNIILFDEFDKPHPLFYSAFYQAFDEGLFEDKNYKVSLANSIIICTSNFQSIEEIRGAVGDPIFFRFDRFIKFNNLTYDAKKEIIEIQVENRFKKLSKSNQKKVDVQYINDRMISVINKLANVRDISRIVDEYFGIQLVREALKENLKQEDETDA